MLQGGHLDDGVRNVLGTGRGKKVISVLLERPNKRQTWRRLWRWVVKRGLGACWKLWCCSSGVCEAGPAGCLAPWQGSSRSSPLLRAFDFGACMFLCS